MRHKALLFILVSVVLIISNVNLRAQTEQQFPTSYPVGLRLFGGFGLPSGKMGASYASGEGAFNRNVGYNIGALLDFHITEKIAVGGEISYASYPDRDYVSGQSRNHYDALSLGGRFQYTIFSGQKYRTYTLFGMGLTSSSLANYYDLEENESIMIDYDNKMYLKGGFGMFYYISPNFSFVGELGVDFLMINGSNLYVDDQKLLNSETDLPLEVEDNYFLIDIKFGFGFNL